MQFLIPALIAVAVGVVGSILEDEDECDCGCDCDCDLEENEDRWSY